MAITYTPYTTQQLIGNYGIIDTVKPFLFDTFFSDMQTFNTAQVGIDNAERSRRIADLEDTAQKQGSATALPTYETSLYTPARIKVRGVIDPHMTLVRRGGEQYNGDLSPMQRRDIIVMQLQRQQDAEIARREEYMASEALIKGTVTIKGEYTANPQVITFNRPLGNTVNLSPAANNGNTALAWGAPGIDPLTMLNTWSAQVQKSSGYLPNIVVMDPISYNLFLHSPGVTEIMTSFNQQNGYLNLAGYPVGGIGNEAALQGKVGQFEIWSYQSFFTDNTGTLHQMMPDNTVIMGNKDGAGGRRLYGAIMDSQSLVPVKRFPSVWYSPDAGFEYVQTQSSPLVTLGWSQATFCATVA